MPFYNVKALVYPDEVQVRIYEKSVYVGQLVDDAANVLKAEIKDLDDEIIHYDSIVENMTPWGTVAYSPGELDPDVQALHDKSVQSSLGRSINRLYEYTRCNIWEYFFTFTLSDEKVDRYDYDACIKKVSNFFHNSRNKGSPDIKYIIVPELHLEGKTDKDGRHAWHFHALVSDIGEMKLTRAINNQKTYKGRKNKLYGLPLVDSAGNEIYNIKGFTSGFTTVTKIKDSYKAAMYVTKYVTKEMIEKLPNKRRFIPSQNLKLPDKILYYGEEFESDKDVLAYIGRIKDLFSKEITHVKSTCVTSDHYKSRVHYVELK